MIGSVDLQVSESEQIKPTPSTHLAKETLSPFISFQYPQKTGELLDTEILVERSSRSGVSCDEASQKSEV